VTEVGQEARDVADAPLAVLWVCARAGAAGSWRDGRLQERIAGEADALGLAVVVERDGAYTDYGFIGTLLQIAALARRRGMARRVIDAATAADADWLAGQGLKNEIVVVGQEAGWTRTFEQAFPPTAPLNSLLGVKIHPAKERQNAHSERRVTP
jgi:hypothetical protein